MFFFSHLGFWSGNLFLIAPFPDRCLIVPSVRFKNIKRFETELKWIKLLQTPFQSKRKSRSHGMRKKGNDKRKRCAAMKLNTSLNDLAVIQWIHGRHSMFSYLSSLPIAVLRFLDREANRFYDRNHQMYDAALLTRCYTHHALRPFIDSESYHIRRLRRISDTEAPFLDLHLTVAKGFVSSKIYDKRDDFDFDIVNSVFGL